MGKLSNLKPSISALAPRLGYQPGDEKARNHTRYVGQPWRAWYRLARWQKLRRHALARDLYTCRMTGVLLYHKHPHPHSPVVDHIKPHRGDPKLFWDAENLQVLAKCVHDQMKQAEERKTPAGRWD